MKNGAVRKEAQIKPSRCFIRVMMYKRCALLKGIIRAFATERYTPNCVPCEIRQINHIEALGSLAEVQAEGVDGSLCAQNLWVGSSYGSG